jgi:hypothetical protein
MHFCARRGCRQAYHQQCLLRAGHMEFPSTDRDFRLLSSSPDSDADVSVTDLSAIQSQGGDQRGQPSEDPWMATLSEVISTLPPELSELASQPILKGGEGGSVVGNVKSVVAARRMVDNVVTGPPSLSEEWQELVDTAPKYWRKEALPPLICPKCKGPI